MSGVNDTNSARDLTARHRQCALALSVGMSILHVLVANFATQGLGWLRGGAAAITGLVVVSGIAPLVSAPPPPPLRAFEPRTTSGLDLAFIGLTLSFFCTRLGRSRARGSRFGWALSPPPSRRCAFEICPPSLPLPPPHLPRCGCARDPHRPQTVRDHALSARDARAWARSSRRVK